MQNTVEKSGTYIGARRLYVERWIPGLKKRQTPVFFIHGSYLGSWSWERYLGYFSERGWECFAPNWRGRYKSSTTDLSKVKFADYLEDIKEAIKHFSKEPVIIATSSGGLIIQKYIENNPAKAVILINSIPPKGIPLPWVDESSLRDIPPVIALEKDTARAELPDMSQEDFNRYFLLYGKEAGPASREWRSGIEIDASKISCRILVVGTGLDTRTTPEITKKTAKFYNADYLYFEKASHHGALLGDNWEPIARALHQWLEDQGL